MSEDTKDPTKAESAEPKPEAEPEAKPDAEPKTSVQDSEGTDPPKTPAKADDVDDAVLDATGRERPRFLLGFPDDPDLNRLVRAFEAGNYALVREEAEALAERSESPAVRAASLELRRRIDPDPLVKYLLALTAALLLSLAYFAYHH